MTLKEFLASNDAQLAVADLLNAHKGGGGVIAIGLLERINKGPQAFELRLKLANTNPPVGYSILVFHDKRDGSHHLEGSVPISSSPAQLRPFLDAQKPAGVHARIETEWARLRAEIPYPASPAKLICDMLTFLDGLAREDGRLSREASLTSSAAP